MRHISIDVHNQAKKNYNLGYATSFLRSTSLSQAIECSPTFSKSCGNFPNLPVFCSELEDEAGDDGSNNNNDIVVDNFTRCHPARRVTSSGSSDSIGTNLVISQEVNEDIFGSHQVIHEDTAFESNTSGQRAIFSVNQSRASTRIAQINKSVHSSSGSQIIDGRVVQSSSVSSSSSSATLASVQGGGGLQVQQKYLNVTNSFPNLVDMAGVVPGPASKKKLPRTLSTSALRIKTRSPFWEKFWGSDQTQSSGIVKQ